MTQEKLQELEAVLADLDSQRAKLIAEISSLRSSLTRASAERPLPVLIGRSASPNVPVAPKEKIALFLKLFRCREDVYPKRWENTKTNKQGYSPVCDLEWVKPICQKPMVKCSECPHVCQDTYSTPYSVRMLFTSCPAISILTADAPIHALFTVFNAKSKREKLSNKIDELFENNLK